MDRIVRAIAKVDHIRSVHLVRQTTHAMGRTVHNDRVEVTHFGIEHDSGTYLGKLETALQRGGFETQLMRDGIAPVLTASRKGKHYRITASSSKGGTTIQKGLTVAHSSRIGAIEAALLNRNFRIMMKKMV